MREGQPDGWEGLPLCGIAGRFLQDSKRDVDPELLHRMVEPLHSRGPDDVGFHFEPGLGLGHARLSIIDLQTGQQPIRNEDGTIWTVFNGEIFNYVELRAELEAKGHRFYTQTDTEVLVHLYEDLGVDFVHRLNGQFAIALWDRRTRSLHLVRDRPGILPLYLHRTGRALTFASEVKGILPALPTRPSLDPRALDQILTFWGPTSPNTVFQGIEEVGPGEIITVTAEGTRRRRYWDWEYPPPDEHRSGNDAQLAEELLALLLDATMIRLRADVPVGAYLSGGLDSSAITALIQRFGPSHLRSFSVTFDDPGLDERAHQDRVREHLGSDHSSIDCTGNDIATRFWQTVWRTEAPVLRTAPTPLSILSGLVRASGYKVVLTGEGADEVLGGYDLFKETKVRQFWARHPDSEGRAALLRRLYPYLDLHQRQGLPYLKRFFGQGLDTPDHPFFSHLPRWTTTARIKDFYSDEMKEQLTEDPLEDLLPRMHADFASWHPFHRAQYLEAKTLMASYLLSSQGDRMLMANSVEGRFPFLDHRLIEFANTLDPRHKMRGLVEKSLLKRAMEPYLPEFTVRRHKQPYRAPDVAAFFQDGQPHPVVLDALSPESVRAAGYFDPDRVTRLVRKAASGRAVGAKDNMAFVGVLSTQLWHRTFVDGQVPTTPEAVSQA